MLQANVGHDAVIDDARLASFNADNYLLHVVRLKRMLLAKIFECVESRLNRRTHAPLLDVGFHDVVVLAEFVNEAGRISRGRMRIEEIIRSRKNVIDSRKASLHEQRSGNAAARRAARKHKRLLDVLRVMY